MKLLADECVYGRTLHLLQSLGHEVVEARTLAGHGAGDSQVLRLAHEHHCVLLTHDLQFTSWSAPDALNTHGIIALRGLHQDIKAVESILAWCITKIDGQDLRQVLVVVDSRKYRIRRFQ